jgi:hypothetical protein
VNRIDRPVRAAVLLLVLAGLAVGLRIAAADEPEPTVATPVAEEAVAGGDDAGAVAAAADTGAESGADVEATTAANDAVGQGLEANPDHENPDSEADRVITSAAAGDPAALPGPAAAAVASAATRVRLKLDVAGELFAPAGPDAPQAREPIAVDARFDFVESAGVDGHKGASVRTYADASAELTIAGERSRITLPNDARTVLVALQGTTATPYLADAFLAREERDLLETPFDPLLLDALRPEVAVAAGDSWDVPADIAAGLLAIDTIESGGIRATLTGIEDGRAAVAFAGIVDGAADGMPTHVVVEGACAVAVTANPAASPCRLDGPVVSVTATWRERREAGHVAPGFDIEARLSCARSANDPSAPQAGADAAIDPGSRRLGNGRPELIWHRDRSGQYDLVHDDRWRVIEDGAQGLVMRLVDRGALVGQCSITALPRSDARPPQLAEVQRDVERSLAGQFDHVVHASEATRSDGVRIVRVEAAGTAEGRPFRWMHHVLADGAGHRVAVTCMVEQPMAKRFAAADRDLVDGLVVAPGNGAGGRVDGPKSPPDDREARVPAKSLMP